MRTTLISIALLSTALWASAQQSSQERVDRNSSDHKTVQGCVSRSDGGFVLTDSSGKRYELTGATDDQLKRLVDREVQISGKSKETNAPNSMAPNTPAETTRPGLEVSDVKKVSDSCANSKSRSDSETKPMSEQPPVPR